LDEDGATFPMQAADWHVGTYVSEVTGRLSHRLAFEHRSAHLGDSLQGLRTPIFYSRESFQYTVAYRPVDWCRAYAKWGVWYNMYPAGAALFASAGMEFVTAPSNFLGTSIKGYASGDLQGVQETSAFNKTFQLGIQWKFKEEESRDMRLALLYYDGLSQYGQFRQDVDEHWGLGLFFDP
jgi:hypothetical protein